MARLTGVPCVVVAISGLGSVFVTRRGSVQWLRYVVVLLYIVALGHSHLKAIFQNHDDQAMLVSLGAVRDDQTILIRGSGVSLTDYTVQPEPKGKPVVTFASRLLREKGVFEFVEAARILESVVFGFRFG